MNKLAWTILITVAFVVLIWLVFSINSPFENQAANTSTPTPVTSSTSGANSGTKSVLSLTNVTPNLSYGQAINKYTGKLMQFDPTCHPQPYPNLTTKNGNQIMFDNRSNRAITLAFDTQKVPLKAWGWTVLALRDSQLPHKILIDCNNGQNYGSVLLQK